MEAADSPALQRLSPEGRGDREKKIAINSDLRAGLKRRREMRERKESGEGRARRGKKKGLQGKAGERLKGVL